MAIAKMSRLRILGLKSDKNAIMNELIESGAFEAVPSVSGKESFADRSHLEKAFARQAKVAFAIEFLDKCADEYESMRFAAAKKGNAALAEFPETEIKKSGGRKIIGYDDFYDVAAKEYELGAVCDELEKLSFARVEYKSAIQKSKNKVKAIEPYSAFPLKFSQLGDGESVSVMLVFHPSGAAVSFGDYPAFTEKYPCASGSLTGVIVRLCDKEKAVAALSSAGYSLCALTDNSTAEQLLGSYGEEIRAAETKSKEALLRALGYRKYYSDLKILYDVIGRDIEKTSAELEFSSTQSTFIAEGWVPSDAAESVLERIKSKTERIVVSVEKPADGDSPPTLIVSTKIVKPYEDVTNMYSVPAYNEIDPNPFMAVFFFVFFGIMIGDAGYGIILSIVAGLVLKFVKLEKGTARLVALVAMGGVSAIIWGALFGGLFSISGIPHLWFNPTEEPLMMLGVSIVLGVVQLLTGYALNSAKKFREHKPLDAILDSVFIFLLFGGLACLALYMLLDLSKTVMTVGLGLMIASLAGILLTAGRHNKGVLSKIMGGFSGLYGLVNLLSDVLSYARLFGLGLASGAIGMAFNTLGSMFFSIPIAGYAIGIIILVPLHAFNLGIGVLGAYVHNARLQFLEFYGKFYEGGGRPFSPMGEKTKYVRFS